MRQEVKYLLQCYMGEEGLPEGNDEKASSSGLVHKLFQGLWGDFQIFPGNTGVVSAGICQSPTSLKAFNLGNAQPQILERVTGRAVHGALLNNQQRQRIRELARNLRGVADNLDYRRVRALSEAELANQLQGLNRDEIRVVRNIHADGFSVSRAVEHLRNCLTYRTMRAALQFVSLAGQTISEELAMACELTTSLVRHFFRENRTFSSEVLEVIDDFIADRLDLG